MITVMACGLALSPAYICTFHVMAHLSCLIAFVPCKSCIGKRVERSHSWRAGGDRGPLQPPAPFVVVKAARDARGGGGGAVQGTTRVAQRSCNPIWCATACAACVVDYGMCCTILPLAQNDS